MNGEIVKFKYPGIFADHYRYRGAADNHNALRYDSGTKYQFSLESKWATTWWPIQVFAFFIARTEGNAYLAMKTFLNTDDKFMGFRKMLNTVSSHSPQDIPYHQYFLT